MAQSDGTCACAAPYGLSAPLDPTTCSPVYIVGGLIGGVVGGSVFLVSLFVAYAFVRLHHWHVEEGQGAWRIKKGEISVDRPPVVLGIG